MTSKIGSGSGSGSGISNLINFYEAPLSSSHVGSLSSANSSRSQNASESKNQVPKLNLSHSAVDKTNAVSAEMLKAENSMTSPRLKQVRIGALSSANPLSISSTKPNVPQLNLASKVEKVETVSAEALHLSRAETSLTSPLHNQKRTRSRSVAAMHEIRQAPFIETAKTSRKSSENIRKSSDVAQVGSRQLVKNPFSSPLSPRDSEKEKESKAIKYIEQKMKFFLKKDFDNLSFEIFQTDCFFGQLTRFMVKLKAIENELKKYFKKNTVDKEDSLNVFKQQLEHLLSSSPENNIYNKVEELRNFQPLIAKLIELNSYFIKTKSSHNPLYALDESDLKFIQFMLDWNISNTFYWTQTKSETTYKIPATEIMRSLSPKETNRIIADVFLNGSHLIKADTLIESKEELFTTLITAIDAAQGLSEIAVTDQVSLFLFFVYGEPKALRVIHEALLSPTVNWDLICETLKFQIPRNLMEKFESLQPKLLKNMQKAFAEIPYFDREDPLSVHEIFSFLDTINKGLVDWKIVQQVLNWKASKNEEKSQFERKMDTYAQSINVAIRKSENTLLRLLVPPYKALQLCTVNCLGYATSIYRTYLPDLNNGSCDLLMRSTADVKRSFHLTVEKDQYSIQIPLQYAIYPKINPEDKDCVQVHLGLRYITLNTNLIISSDLQNIQGKIETALIVHKEGKKNSAKILDVLKSFQKSSVELRTLFPEKTFSPFQLRYQEKPESKSAHD